MPRSTDRTAVRPSQDRCCPVVELRRYALQPGRRDDLIELFDREFVESQEALGARIIGQFRHLDDPDAFVWLRGFPDMPSRAATLAAFYYGPVWRAHRERANATMIDSDNVRLLRPAVPMSGFAVGAIERLPVDSETHDRGLVVANIRHINPNADAAVTEAFERDFAPVLAETGASVLSYFVTETSVNTFPALPVVEGERVFVWFSLFGDIAAYDNHLVAMSRSARTHNPVFNAKSPGDVWRLAPTARSLIG